MAMTKKQARAILKCHEQIVKALDKCEAALGAAPIGPQQTINESIGELTYMQCYWGSHIRQSISGHVFGSMPLMRAREVADDE